MTVKVLIVEDNPVARAFLAKVVRESFSDDIAITEAGDLEQARERVAIAGGDRGRHDADPFRLILVDLELPDGNGMDLLSQLAHHPATKIVTTLYSDDDHLFPALQRGADGYLLKEDRFEVLVEELQKIVRGQPPLSPAIARRLLTHLRAPAADDDAGDAAPDSIFTLPGEPAPGAPTAPAATPPPRLAPREREVLTYLSKGFTIKEIASLMGIKWFAVNDHIKAIYKKLDASSRAEAAARAARPAGLV